MLGKAVTMKSILNSLRTPYPPNPQRRRMEMDDVEVMMKISHVIWTVGVDGGAEY